MGSRLESNSNAVRKRIEGHTFDHEEGEEYDGSKFGGFSDYFRRKKIKLQNLDAELRSQTADNPPIFRGVVAQVNGYTQPSLNDLHKLIVSHGGGFMQYLDGKTTVTHIIASSLTPKKVVEFRKYRVVKPAWVVESVKAGRLLPWDSFRVVDEGVKQKVLGFANGEVVSQVNKQSRGYRDQTDTSWYTDQLKDNATPRSSFRSPFLKQSPTPSQDAEDDILEDDGTCSDMFSFKRRKENPQHSSSHDAPFLTPQSDPRQEREEECRYPSIQADQQDDRRAMGHPEAALSEIELSREASELPLHEKAVEGCNDDRNVDIERSVGLKRARSDRTESPSKRTKLTAEEHNAILLADPKVWKSTVVNPEFLEQYYRESRLHHLSTWKADLKAQLQALTAEKTASQKQREKRPAGTRRYILHVDFDSFFAAVSLKKSPQYKDKPTVVAHGNGIGSEIASCNYPARKFGVKNGMWMKRALDLCPELKILPYDFPAYEEASRAFYEAIINTGGIVQSVSIDEALLDVSSICIATGGSDGKKQHERSNYREQIKADEIAESLRKEVKLRTDCEVSVGIGANILLAKVALRKAKPAGQYQIKPEETLEFIGNLEVQDLPGVAYSIGGKLEEVGIKYVRHIRDFSREKLIHILGPKTGEKIWEYSRGIDRAEVGDVVVRKSVSAEVNWGVRFENQAQVEEFIESLCGELNRRLLKEGVKGRQLTLKVMRRAADAPLDPPKHLGHGKCHTYNKAVQLGVATNDPEILTRETLSVLKCFGFSPGELRGIGVQMTKLDPLRSAAAGIAESSQRKLQFKVGKTRPKAPERDQEDPIEDVVTPQKPKAIPGQVVFGADQLNSSTPSRKPLNTLGTQFILPTQVDPKVLAELPEDIRAKLAKRISVDKTDDPFNAREQDSPVQTAIKAPPVLPTESQLDLETLEALPADVRAEVLSYYQNSPSRRKRGREQSLLSQSPHKPRAVPLKKSLPPPGPRKRGRPPGSKNIVTHAAKNGTTLTQSNFIPARLKKDQSNDTTNSTTDTEAEADDRKATRKGREKEDNQISAEFLAALPEDIRREVLAEHRGAKMQKKSALALPSVRRKLFPQAKQQQQPAAPPLQRMLQLPPKPARPTFTTAKLSSPEDLRRAIKAWVEEFADDGPYGEDVGALIKYLTRVIEDERDLEKAVGVVKWMAWVVEEVWDDEQEREDGRTMWEQALGWVKDGLQGAVKRRGLGAVTL